MYIIKVFGSQNALVREKTNSKHVEFSKEEIEMEA